MPAKEGTELPRKLYLQNPKDYLQDIDNFLDQLPFILKPKNIQ